MNTEINDKKTDFLYALVTSEANHNDPLEVSLAYKLFLIGRLKKSKRSLFKGGGAAISDALFLESGVYISAQECQQLVKQYECIMPSKNIYAVICGFITAIVMYVAAGGGAVNTAVILLLIPFLIVCYNEVIIFKRLVAFNFKKLVPPVVTASNFLGSTAVIIASRNEPYDVAKMTFDSALKLVYPSGKKEIIVVDNSDVTFPEYQLWKSYVESFSVDGERCTDGVRVIFIHRDGTEGFKPRNLDMALEEVRSEFILYLDVDSTVQEDTLLRVTPMFLYDKNLCFVQLHTLPTNTKSKSPLALVQGLRNYLLRLETVFYAHTNHCLFFGHNAIWRTSAVKSLGECLEYHDGEVVVTEDLSMSFRSMFKGGYGIGAWLECGEWVPESLRETEAMWLRWTVGTYQVYGKHFTKIENLKKFSTYELIGWLQHLGVLLTYGLIPLSVACGLFFNSMVFMSLAFLSFLPEIAQGWYAYRKLSIGGMKPFAKIFTCYSAFMVLGSFINWVRSVGLFRYLARRKQGWSPTGKANTGSISPLKGVLNYLGFLLFGVVCLSYSIFSVIYVAEGAANIFLVSMCGLYGLNSILAVFLYGTSNMQEEAAVAAKDNTIENYLDFYT